MDPSIQALLQAMQQQQQKECMDRLAGFARPESVNVPAITPPKFETFEKSKETWEQYLKRLKQNLQLHNVVENDKKKSVFTNLSWPRFIYTFEKFIWGCRLVNAII